MRRSTAWAMHSKGADYSVGPWHFERPATETEFRRFLREKFLNVTRLPAGTDVWPVQVTMTQPSSREHDYYESD